MDRITKRTILRALPLMMVMMIVLSIPASALEIPRLQGRVNDYANILSSSQEMTLDNLLESVEEKTSSQVALLTITSLEDEVLEDYSMRVVEKWQLGQKEFDNGVLVLVSMAERKMRIEAGYGLEPILTDAKSSYIIRQLMVPEFKRKRYYAGLTNGLTAVTGLITKEFEITPQQLKKFQRKQRRGKGAHLPFGTLIFLFIILVSFLKNIFRGGSRGVRRGSSAIFWGSAIGGSSHHRHSSSGFFGGGGGFGGGGFSGGGGGFGGGGASGGW